MGLPISPTRAPAGAPGPCPAASDDWPAPGVPAPGPTPPPPDAPRAGAPTRRWPLLLGGLVLLHLNNPLIWDLHSPALWFPPAGLALVLVAWLGPAGALLAAGDGLLVGLQLVLTGAGWAPVGPAVLGGLLTALEAACAWWLYSRATRGTGSLGDPRSATLFLLIVPGAVGGVFALLRVGLCRVLAAWPTWLSDPAGMGWYYLGFAWVSDALGSLALAPVMLVVATPCLVRLGLIPGELRRLDPERALPRRLTWGDRLELTGLALGTGVLGLILAVGYGGGDVSAWQLWGLPLLLIVWACLRQGVRGGTVVTAAAAILCLAVGPLVAGGRMPLTPLQGNLLAQCMAALLVGSSVTWIRAREARYRQVVAHIPVVLYSVRVVDWARQARLPRAEITFISPAARQVFGGEPEQLLGDLDRWLRRVHPQDQELVAAALAQLCMDHRPVTYEYRLVPAAAPAPGGHREAPAGDATAFPPADRWVRDTIVPQVGADGRVEGWEGVAEDITEQRALAGDLQRTTRMFHALVANLPAGVFFVHGPTGQPILVNARARHLLGQREDATAGLAHLPEVYRLFRSDGTLYPAGELPVSKALNQGITCMCDDLVVRRPDGRRIPLVSWAAPVQLNGHRGPDAAVWVLEDLTALRQAEAARQESLEVLRQSEEKYRGLVETLPLMLWQCDRAMQMTYVNPATQAVLGYGLEELRRPEDWKALVYPEDLGRVAEIERTTLAGETCRAEIRLRARDGSQKVCYALCQPHRHHGEVAGLTVLAVDMTRERHLEHELQRVQRLELIGRLAGGIAHDFNNLLTVVLTLSDLAQDYVPPEHPVRDFLRRIDEAGEQAARLAGQLLTFSKPRRAASRRVDVNPVIAKTLDMLRGTLPSAIQVKSELGVHDLFVEADETRLQQVIMNLCLNARDAMPHGGQLVVQTAVDTGCGPGDGEGETLPPGGPARPPSLSCASRPATTWVRLTVGDTGHGMEEDVKARIFDPFFSTKERGTGLGLAVVQQIIESFGGRVKVWSKPGQGTRFDVWLPRA